MIRAIHLYLTFHCLSVNTNAIIIMSDNVLANEHLVTSRIYITQKHLPRNWLQGSFASVSRNWDRPLLSIFEYTVQIYRIWLIVTGKLVFPLVGGRLIVSFGQCLFDESCGTGGSWECRGEGGPVPGATHDSSFRSPDVMEESCSGSTPLALLLSSSFFHFMRRFWNQILMCLSVRLRVSASSTRRGREMYLLKRNSFSSSSSCALVYAVRVRLFSSASTM